LLQKLPLVDLGRATCRNFDW